MFTCVKKADWAMHRLECSAMVAFGENWCPSETSRLVARILAKKVRHQFHKDCPFLYLRGCANCHDYLQKMQKGRCDSEKILLIGEMQSRESHTHLIVYKL